MSQKFPEIPKFKRGVAVELNFIGDKLLMSLSPEELELVYTGLHSEGEELEKAAETLVRLIAFAPNNELTDYVNDVLGLNISHYIFDYTEGKGFVIICFFHHKLKKLGEGKFTVDRIEISPKKRR